jgi:hypothetical protein
MDLFDLTGSGAAVVGGTGVLGGALAHGLGEAGAAVAVMGGSAGRGDVRVAGAALLAAAGIDADRSTRILAILGALACLEALAALPRRAVDERREWGRRVAGCLDRV